MLSVLYAAAELANKLGKRGAIPRREKSMRVAGDERSTEINLYAQRCYAGQPRSPGKKQQATFSPTAGEEKFTSTKLNLDDQKRTLAEKKTSLQNYLYNYKKEILRGISDFLLMIQV